MNTHTLVHVLLHLVTFPSSTLLRIRIIRYDAMDLEDIYGHLTNTARAAEDVNFDEAKFVRVSSEV